jgi:hypothetical protein
VLDGHVALDLACLDRVDLNDYVPNLRVVIVVGWRAPLCLPGRAVSGRGVIRWVW